MKKHQLLIENDCISTVINLFKTTDLRKLAFGYTNSVTAPVSEQRSQPSTDEAKNIEELTSIVESHKGYYS